MKKLFVFLAAVWALINWRPLGAGPPVAQAHAKKSKLGKLARALTAAEFAALSRLDREVYCRLILNGVPIRDAALELIDDPVTFRLLAFGRNGASPARWRQARSERLAKQALIRAAYARIAAIVGSV
jgi:hypothetical protein